MNTRFISLDFAGVWNGNRLRSKAGPAATNRPSTSSPDPWPRHARQSRRHGASRSGNSGTDGKFTLEYGDRLSTRGSVNFPSGGCEKIDFANFIGVWFLIRNVHPSLSNRLEGILARSFFDCRSLVSRKPIFSNAPVPEFPAEPHWHLGPVAIEPCVQHRGVGSAL